ncbi:MAG: 6-carboxytetrahydropterin synthase [Gemmatimonadales bacterium]|nr:6-carboxytetrahydropterin synthase [Gemmatimonadales bacterium]
MARRHTLTRTLGFRAMHRFHRPDWSEARNREVWGPVGEAPGHWHDFTCTVTVSGALDADRGMLVDLVALDRILDDEVRRPLDGRHMNLDLPAFAYGATYPTCEALAAHLFERIAARLPAGTRLERVAIAEDATLSGECQRADD